MPKFETSLNWGRLLKLLAIPALTVSLVFIFYIWQLGSSTSGLSPAENAYLNSSNSFQAIVDSPIYAPHKLVQFAMFQAGLDSQLLLRLPSVLFVLAFLGLFYLLLKIWFGRLVGLLGVLLLAGTPWVVLIAKSALPDILLLTPLALISIYLWLNRRQSKLNIMWLIMAILLGLSLYVPGMLWVLGAATLTKHRQIFNIIKKINPYALTAGTILFLGLISPLVKALFQHPSLLKPLLLIPEQLSPPVEIAKSVGWAALSLVWRLPYPTDLTVGRLPLLTVSLLALSAFGAYAMWTKARQQAYGLLGLGAASIVFAGLNKQLTILLPTIMVLCVFAAAGLRYLYVEWNSIFPRNPLPRYMALVLMTALVSLHLFYGFRYAQIAWPNSPATKRVYVLKYDSQ